MFSTCVLDNNTPNTRNFTRKLTNKGQRGLSCLGPSIWNSIGTRCEVIPTLNTIKNSIKSTFLKELRFIDNDIDMIVFSVVLSSTMKVVNPVLCHPCQLLYFVMFFCCTVCAF